VFPSAYGFRPLLPFFVKPGGPGAFTWGGFKFHRWVTLPARRVLVPPPPTHSPRRLFFNTSVPGWLCLA